MRAGDLIYGDAELDSSIDAVDMLKISQNAAGYPDVPLLGNADASGHECALAVVDALAIRHYLLGYRSDLPAFIPPACWAIGLTATDGDGQVCSPNQTLPQPLEVTLNNIPACTQTLSGCTLGGVTITYDITGDGTGGAVLSGGVTSLDIDTSSSGKVSTLLTLGPVSGVVTVVASLNLLSAEGGLLNTISLTFTAGAFLCNISSVGPTTGCPGDAVTISGSDFGPNTGTVSFNAVPAAIISWTDTSIVVEAPGGDYTTMTVTPSVTNECSLTGSYSYDDQAPTGLAASPAGGSYCVTTVSLGASDGTIYYTFDGSGPTTLSPVYVGPIDITVDTMLRFMAVDSCGNQSGTVTEVYDIDNEAPTGLAAIPAGGSYCPTTVSLIASDGTIYYTIDGSGPTTGSPVYAGPIDISVDTTLKFIAVDACGNQAGTVTEVYDIDSEAVVTITEPVNGVTIWTGDLRVAGIADTDIITVTVTSDQGHSESSPVVAGGWTVILTGISTPSIVITAEGTDDCGNTGSDSVTAPVTPPCIWYVNDDATGNNDGTSWENAFTVVQDAVDAAVSGCMVWVAEGTYTNSPTSSAPVMTMEYGVGIYGGFSGTESSFLERDAPAGYPTILDGEDVSYHVVVGASNALLDGFIITGGNANGSGFNDYGGGMFNFGNSSLKITNCTFIGNSAWKGGGIYNEFFSPDIINCIFSGNSAYYGCGMYNKSSSPDIINCIFIDNSADFSGSGGGMYNTDNSLPTIINCIFSGNSAEGGGGGMYNNYSDPTIVNCTFSDNLAAPGGGMYNYYSDPIITNCIMWGDDSEIINSSSTPIVTYSNIQGSYPGTGNIDADPLFASGPNGDYYLSQTTAGQGSDSPCVDAGSDTAANLGLDGRATRTDGVTDTDIVDIGYHYWPLDITPPAGLAASPAGGSVCLETSVTLSCDDPSATIYYTLDGTGPTTASPIYSGPIDISVDTTLKFIAVDTCGNQ
ncbi:MAG: chitobiase/beta-hexosaminidase C-terminal domain-containing protein, partial [Deltaproteobacteria bacterium]